jgi:hypothetical protein
VSAPDGVTPAVVDLAVLGTKVDGLRQSVDTLSATVAPLAVAHAATNARVDEQGRRLAALEAANAWLWRTVAGLVIAAVVGAVLVKPLG